MKNITSWIKILANNIFVLIVLLTLAEIGARLAWTAYVCYANSCDFSRLSSLKIYDDGFTEKNIGLSTYDEVLGYIPTPGFSSLINADGWQNALVTIDPDGFRVTDKDSTNLKENSVILTVGDSFTFGDQVSNTETWPSCIEYKTNRRTLNAGVFGYGAAQAVRRASVITQQRNVDTIILSVLVNDDFHRDRLRFKSGFPHPAVIQSEKGLSYAEVPSIDSNGTKWHPDNSSRILATATKYSYLLTKILIEIGYDTTGMRRTESHENAADLNQIIAFTIRKFSSLDVKNKFIVLQYTETDFPSLSSEVARIIEQLLSEAQLVDISVIDTYNRLQVELLNSANSIWNGHHTPYGNDLVCDEIYQAIQNSH